MVQSERTLRVRTADGWELDVWSMPPRGATRGVALLGPAMMVDRRSMDRPAGGGLASTLCAAGWHVLLADLRGHGASGPTPRQGGSWSYDDLVRFDLPALVAAARAQAPGLPLALVGHSLTAHVAVAVAAAQVCEQPPDLHVLFAPNIWMRGFDAALLRDLRRAAQMAAFVLLSVIAGRFPSRAVRMGPADEALPYVLDLARFFFTGRWRSRDGRHDYLAGMGNLRGPVLALVGAADALMAHPDAVRRFCGRMTGADVDLRVLHRGAHGLVADPDHMRLVTDPGSAGLWEEVARWLTAHAPRG